MGPDELEAVTYTALVVGPLENVAVPGALVPDHFRGHLFELFPGLRWFREAAPLQQILAIVEHPGIHGVRHAVDLAFVREGLYGSIDELAPRILGKAVGDVRDPVVCPELGGPDGISGDNVYSTASDLELGLEFLEVLPVVLGHLADGDPAPLVLPVELLYELVLGLLGNALPISENHVA